MKSYCILLTTIAVLSVFTHSSVFAESLKVGIMDFPPFLIAQKNKIGGSELERLKRVLLLEGIDFTVEGYPHRRLYGSIRNGVVDLILASKTHQKYSESTIHSHKPIKTLELRLYHHRKVLPLNSTKEWIDKEFIIINGLGYGGLLSQLESQEKKGLMILYRVNQHTSALKMLLKRRGDYLLDYRAPTTEAITILGIESEIRFTTVHTVDVYVILGKHVKNARNLLNRIEKGYQQISK